MAGAGENLLLKKYGAMFADCGSICRSEDLLLPEVSLKPTGLPGIPRWIAKGSVDWSYHLRHDMAGSSNAGRPLRSRTEEDPAKRRSGAPSSGATQKEATHW